MTLGSGCWAPGIGWDAENSAAFKGPRAGAWPYSTPCTLAAKNGLNIDPNTGKLWLAPPAALYPYRQSWTTASGSASPQPNTLISPAGNQPLFYGGVAPQVVIPVPSCGYASLRERLSLTFDVTVGSDAWLTVQQGTQTVALFDNSHMTLTTAQAKDSISSGSGGITPGPGTWTTNTSGGAVTYADEPWGTATTGLNSAAGCVYTDGITGYVRQLGLTTMNWAGDWTIGVWVRALSVPSGGNWAPIWSFGNSAQSNVYFAFAWVGGNATFGIHSSPVSNAFSNDATYTFSDPTFTSHWYHVVVTHTGSTNKVALYVNGVQQIAPVALVNSIWTPTSSSGMQYAAFFASSSSFVGNMALHNGMVYARVLTGTEVTALYTNPANAGALPSGAVSWLKLNDGMNRRRIVETVDLPTAFTGTDNTSVTLTRRAIVTLYCLNSQNSNPCVVNGWSLTLDGCALSPNA